MLISVSSWGRLLIPSLILTLIGLTWWGVAGVPLLGIFGLLGHRVIGLRCRVVCLSLLLTE